MIRRTAVAFENEKDAALYFDNVIPLNPYHLIDNNPHEFIIVAKNILPDYYYTFDELTVRLKDKCNGNETANIQNNPFHGSIIPIPGNINLGFSYHTNLKGTLKIDLDSYYECRKENQLLLGLSRVDTEKELIKHLKNNMIDDYAVIGGSYEKKAKINNDTCLQLVNLRLIDTSKAEWKQIIEIRQDKESIKKLRNLRCFFEEKMVNSDFEYIKDKMSLLLDEYIEASRKHGFELFQSVLSSILPRDTLFSTIMGCLIKNYFDLYNYQEITIPLSFMLVDMSINIFNTSYSRKKQLSKNPLAYIIDINKKINYEKN